MTVLGPDTVDAFLRARHKIRTLSEDLQALRPFLTSSDDAVKRAWDLARASLLDACATYADALEAVRSQG